MPPTGQPPQIGQIPEVTQGPFSQYLQPTQGPAVQESEQGQHRQFNGYEGTTGKVAGLLTRFIEGASVGRARGEAAKAAQQAQKESRDAQSINQYLQMVSASDIDPEAKQKLQMQALQMQGHWAVKELDTAGQTNPLMKGLAMIGQTLMGGPPSDERSEVDPKTGKKKKVKDVYEGGVDPQKMNDLWTQLAGAPTRAASGTQKSAQLNQKIQQAYDELKAHKNGQEPTQQEMNASLVAKNLYAEGDMLEQRYGVTNPANEYMKGFPSSLDRVRGIQAQREQSRMGMEQEMFGGAPGVSGDAPAQPGTGSASRLPQNGFSVIPERQQAAGAPQFGPPQRKAAPEQYDPQKLFVLSRDKGSLVESKGMYVLDKPGGNSGKYMEIYETPQGFYNKSGNRIPSEQVLEKTQAQARAGSKWQTKNITGPDGYPVMARVNPETNETQVMTWPDGRPMRPSGVNSDPLNKAFKAQSKFDDQMDRYELDETQAVDSLDKEFQRKDADGNPYMTPEQYAARKSALGSRFRQLREHSQTRFNNQQKFFQSQSDDKPISISGMSSSNITERNNNPLALKGQDGFMKFTTPEEGIRAASDNLDRYMSKKGFLGVNEDSTLLDMMMVRDPVGDGANDPEAYAQAISKALNLKDGEETKLSDLRSRKADLMKFMAGFEGGKKFIPDIDKFFGVSATKTGTPPATPYRTFKASEIQ